MVFEEILKYTLENKRPHRSRAIAKLVGKLISLHPEKARRDSFGNVIMDLREGTTGTCFMAHMDTVHDEAGPNHVIWSATMASTGDTAPLGADDGAGVALLAGMASEGLPALYVFTQAEEIGGLGAKYLLKRNPNLMNGVARIISFDRRGTKDICGEQSRGICSSPEFVDEVSHRFAMGHTWAKGTYTDNCEFRLQVPEIVNISVGYQNEHRVHETLDLVYLRSLYQKSLEMDWSSLPVVRSVKPL